MGLIEILIILIIIVVLLVVVAGGIGLLLMKRTFKMAIRIFIAIALLFTFLLFSTLGIYLVYSWTSSSSPSNKNKPTNSKPKK